MHGIIGLIVAVGLLIIAWVITERFSPDPLITLIVKIVIFIVALIIILNLILPLAGVSF